MLDGWTFRQNPKKIIDPMIDHMKEDITIIVNVKSKIYSIVFSCPLGKMGNSQRITAKSNNPGATDPSTINHVPNPIPQLQLVLLYAP